MTNATGPFRSGELARLTGVSADTFRFYEKHSLLARPPRTAGGYRLYPADALQRVRLIRGALSLGFSIAELKQLLRQRDAGAAPCLFARKLVQAKLENVERSLQDLRTYRAILQKAARAWDARIAANPVNARLGLLEAFVEANPESTQRVSPLLPNGLSQSKRKGFRP